MIPTKDRIRKEALSLFATKGFAGTSMKDIADGVGISKAALYSHFSGKEDIFLEVYKQLANDYIELTLRLFEASKGMEVREKLKHIFTGYILYYYKNREYQGFWGQLPLLSPSELKEKIVKDITDRERFFQEQMEAIFQEAIKKNEIREDKPSKMVMSFRAMRDGLLTWMLLVPQINEELVASFWDDYWYGLSSRD
ncbi:TetR/AcrR family transcriptional regulator [Fredinandcohnia humi]